MKTSGQALPPILLITTFTSIRTPSDLHIASIGVHAHMKQHTPRGMHLREESQLNASISVRMTASVREMRNGGRTLRVASDAVNSGLCDIMD